VQVYERQQRRVGGNNNNAYSAAGSSFRANGMNGTNDPVHDSALVHDFLNSRRDHWDGKPVRGDLRRDWRIAYNLAAGSRQPRRAGPGPGADNNNNIFRALFLTGRCSEAIYPAKDTLYPSFSG
jgi:hypothetical protein